MVVLVLFLLTKLCLAACLRPLLSVIFNIHVHGFLAWLFAWVVLLFVCVCLLCICFLVIGKFL